METREIVIFLDDCLILNFLLSRSLETREYFFVCRQ